MTFAEWQQLDPVAASRELQQRLASRLTPAQRRAAIAWMPAASELEDAFRSSSRGPLRGVPCVAKDLFDLPGVPTLAGSTFLPEVRTTPARRANLLSAAEALGLVVAGKTHLHEFAYGITGENPHYGDCEHPNFPGRTTGGSSSGSALAVATGLMPVAFGTDTGGSVRVPAAFCGLYGYRGAPGEAWIVDAFPLAPSFDTAGWFTATGEDMKRMVNAFLRPPSETRQVRGCYLELPGLDEEASRSFQAAARRFAPPADALSASTLRAGFATSTDSYNTIVAAEAWTVHRDWAERYRDRYDPAVWQRLARAHALQPGQVDAARKYVTELRALFASYFETHDFLVLPATPCGALTKADCTPANRMRILALTTPASVAGLPVLTIPTTLRSGLTSGLQIVVPHCGSPALRQALNVA